MAGSDPRRSSRARTTQPQSQISSTTSSTSSRAERSTRYFNKSGSPQKSSSTGSLSSEPLEEIITADDTLATRRRTRGQGEERDKATTKAEPIEMTNGEDDVQEDDEAVRCICGFEEYPGPPPFDEDKYGLKDGAEIDPIFATDVTDEAAGFFVQCDICKDWQHGVCVGIMTQESSPDEYFCDQCRKDLHKIFTASNGQRYSHYLPLKRSSRNTSRSASLNKDGTRSPPAKEKTGRNGRASSENQTSKRRSTMNSRDAGYDEAEALRKAIEASKEDAAPEAEVGLRRGKRGRSNSEEKPESTKRQRTSSRSRSPSLDKAEDSDEAITTGVPTRNVGTRPKSSRGTSNTVTRNQRNEKVSEREERERQRAEAANKRKGRAERRRIDDSDPSEELPLAAARAVVNKATTATMTTTTTSISSGTTIGTGVSVSQGNTTISDTGPSEVQTATIQKISTVPEPPPSSQPTPESPTASAPLTKEASVPVTSSSGVTSGRIDKKRSHKKKGRNQYTRDRDGHDEESPARSQSRDVQKDEQNQTSSGGSGGHSGSGKASTENAGSNSTHGSGGRAHGKAKGGMSSKVTMTDMKRKAAALLDFISRTQVELAGEALTPPESTTTAAKVGAGKSAGEDETAPVTATTEPGQRQHDSAAVEGLPTPVRVEKDFKELNCLEMMDSLTRRLVKWQQEYTV